MPTSPPGSETCGVLAPYFAIEPAYNAALAFIAIAAPLVARAFMPESPGRSATIASASLITKS